MAVTSGQVEIVQKRALAWLLEYYEAPRGLSLEQIVRALPAAACQRLKPHLEAIIDAHSDPTVFPVLLDFFVKAGVLYEPDLEALKRAREEVSVGRWEADFGKIPYRPSLLREALLSRPGAPDVPEAVDGEFVIG